MTIVAVPPVIPHLHQDLALTASAVGLLSSFPPLLFSLAAIPGALLIACFGIKATLLTGLMLNGIASAARGAFPSVAFLYATTIAMSAGVSFMQPAMPPLVRTWFPQRIGFATAVYTNGLIVGEIVVAALTIPVVLPLVRSWQASFVLWSLPVFATALLVALDPRSMRAEKKALATTNAGWWPDWKNPLIWRLGLLLGSINAMYFTGSAFLPDYMATTGHPELIGRALTALNLSQLPASFLMLRYAGRLATRPPAYVATGLLCVLSLVGMMRFTGMGTVICCGLLGFAVAVILILVLALPSILCAPADVHRTSAGMFTISYGSAMLVSIATGLLWETTRLPLSGFLLIALYGLATLPFAMAIGRAKRGIETAPAETLHKGDSDQA